MSNPSVVISDRERQELAGALGGFVYTFFLNQEPTATMAGNRIAAHKTAQIIGRIIAAATYPDKLDTDYLMMARRFEVQFSDVALEAVNNVIRGLIKSAEQAQQQQEVTNETQDD